MYYKICDAVKGLKAEGKDILCEVKLDKAGLYADRVIWLEQREDRCYGHARRDQVSDDGTHPQNASGPESLLKGRPESKKTGDPGSKSSRVFDPPRRDSFPK